MSMRFALLGEHPVAQAVAETIATRPDLELVRCCLPADRPPAARSPLSQVRPARNWEELLTDREVDAVIVGEVSEDWQAAVRQLLQAGKTLLVPPALVQSTAFFYELALTEGETPGRIFPLLDWRAHPLLAEMRQHLTAPTLGPIRHVQFERRVAAPSTGLMPPQTLAAALLRDADLLRYLFGPYDQVNATRSGDLPAGYSLATVTFSGSQVPQAVWTATASPTESGWKLTVLGENGSAILESHAADSASAPSADWQLTLSPASGSASTRRASPDPGPWLITQFLARPQNPMNSAAASGRSQRVAPTSVTPDATATPAESKSQWDELACAVELVDAVERSVKRRRTIDVYFEAQSERGLFKTQMTAAGCSLLMITLVAVVAYLLLASTLSLPDWALKVLLVLTFLPLGIFLALQLLYFVAQPASRDKR
ncbi:MAG: hypothetical protein JSS02_16125 [Planctomycetes bacterium]|nr:hypothetical protein [Planctomycetota bacterium]